MKKSVKILSVVLATLMIVSTLPLSVFAGTFTPVIPVCTEHSGGTATCNSLAVCSNCGIAYGTYSDHIYSNLADATCNACGHEREVIESPFIKLHVYDNECDTICNKCGEERTAPHKGGKATCKELAVCTLCGESYGELNPKNHTGETKLEGDFAPTCNDPGYTGDTYCLDCGAKIREGSEIEPTGEHVDANGEWESDEENHFHTCGCGTAFDVTPHAGGTATCWEKKVCTECGASYGDFDASNHSGGTELKDYLAPTCNEYGYSGDTWCKGCNSVIEYGAPIDPTGDHKDVDSKWEYNETQHYYTCECGTEFNFADHVYDDNCDVDCNECGYVRTAPHSFSEAWITDGESHWRQCSGCGEKKDVARHFGGTATCAEKAQCTECGVSYGVTLDHTYSGVADATCDKCGAERELNESPMICFHRYDNANDPFCNRCGRVRKVAVDENLYFKSAALVLESNLTVKYRVDKARLDSLGYTDPYVIFQFLGEESAPVYPTVTEEEGVYVFLFTDVAANMIGDNISATLYATNSGILLSGEVQDYSAATYCYNKLVSESSSANLKTLVVDLLNYGAQAQLYTGYNTSDLVNADLTEEQKALATSGDPELESVTDVGENNGEIGWMSASLILDNAVTVRIKFYAENIENLVIKIATESYAWTFGPEQFVVVEGDNNAYYLYFDGLNADQMRETIQVTAHRGESQISTALTYSIESYACAKQGVTQIPYLADLVKAMMKYGDSACKPL